MLQTDKLEDSLWVESDGCSHHPREDIVRGPNQKSHEQVGPPTAARDQKVKFVVEPFYPARYGDDTGPDLPFGGNLKASQAPTAMGASATNAAKNMSRS